MKSRNMYLLALLFVLLTPWGLFAQVSKYAKIKKVGRDKFNYHDEVCKLKKDKSLKLVFSDRAQNQAFNDPYSQEKKEKQDILTPYYIIDSKNDAYELVLAEEGIVGKPKGIFAPFMTSKYRFKDNEGVTYVGWIAKNNLLSYKHSFLSPKNNKPLKYKVGITDFSRLFDLKSFFNNDLLYVYEDPLLRTKSSQFVLSNQVVYPYKYNQTKKTVLISDKPTVTKDSDQVFGWIPADLITPIGQNQICRAKENQILPFTKNDEGLELKPHEIQAELLFAVGPNVQEVDSAYRTDSLMVPLSVWDRTKNKLINVLGDDLYTSEIFRMKKESRRTNIHLIFFQENKDDIAKSVNALQKIGLEVLTPNAHTDEYTFSVSCIGESESYFLPPSASFFHWLNYIQELVSQDTTIDSTSPLSLEKSIRKILETCGEENNFESNLFIIIGDGQDLRVSQEVLSLMAEKSSQLLIVQANNSTALSRQDYLLEAKALLDNAAEVYHTFIKRYLVDNSLVARETVMENLTNGEDNLYLYDSPGNSLFNGGLVFPKINTSISSASISLAIDSILARNRAVNLMLTNSLLAYESKLGLLQSEPSEVLEQLYRQCPLSSSLPLSAIDRNSANDALYTTMKSPDLSGAISENGLLLTKEEFNELLDNYRMLLPQFTGDFSAKHAGVLEKIYKRQVKGINKSFKRKVLKKKSLLNRLYYYKTGIPVWEQKLDVIRIKDLSKKEVLEDNFHALYFNLLGKLAKLEKLLLNDQLELVNSLGDVCYFIPFELLL